jgi:hypothetical protein
LADKVLAALSRSAVLPNNRSVQGSSCSAVPRNDRFSLISDSNRCDGPAEFSHQVMENLLRDAPDLGSIVFHPAWLRKVLGELLVASAYGVAFKVDCKCANTRGSGINGDDDCMICRGLRHDSQL